MNTLLKAIQNEDPELNDDQEKIKKEDQKEIAVITVEEPDGKVEHEKEKYQSNTPMPTSMKLTQWSRDAAAVYNIAKDLCKTQLTPLTYRNNPDEVTAIILAGAEIGLTPIQSLRNINYIAGTPTLTAIAMRGLLVAAGHEIWVEKASADQVIVCGRRAGSDRIQQSVWGTDRADKLNLLTKDNWKKQPQAMLIARATAECCRLVAPDALMGICYSSDEIEE